MPEQTGTASPSEAMPTANSPILDPRLVLEQVVAAKSQTDQLMTQIQVNAQAATLKVGEIEQLGIRASTANSEIEKTTAASQGQLADLQSQIEKANTTINEIQKLLQSTQKAREKAASTNTEMLAIFESAKLLATGANGSAAQLGKLVTEAQEKVRTVALVQEQATEIQKQLEKATKTVSDIDSSFSSALEKGKQASDAVSQATAALESARPVVQSISDAATRVESLKTQIEQNAEVAAQRSNHIEDGRKYVDEKRAEIDAIMNRAQQSATNAESQKEASQASAESISTLLSQAQTAKGSVDSLHDAVASLKQESEQYTLAAKNLADIAVNTEKRVKSYEGRLAELEAIARERLKTIESLLPGATSAGLASAFGLRRGYYKWPQRIWQGVFVITVLALLVLAFEFRQDTAKDATLTWASLGLSLLHRLPFALPLIWLAIHAAHKSALAQRVEEDYAFKEAASRSFEGYRREMAELEGKVTPGSPLALLCANTLAIISRRPGLIYEKHPLNKTPLNSLAETVGPVAEAASKIQPMKIGIPPLT